VFDHVLVPLDGSRLAESVLPAAQALARRFGSRVILLHVVEAHPPADVHGERHLATVAEAGAYLAAIARVFEPEAVTVHVHGPDEGGVAALITRHVAEFSAGLTALCTHGSGGARDLLYGSVAEQVLGQGTTPVLLIKPTDHPSTFSCERILVPLDGSGPSEAALPAATLLAEAFGARLNLLTVVPTVATVPTDRAPAALLLPTATAASLEIEEDAAAAYLNGLVVRLRGEGLAVSGEIGRGDPALEVVEAADRSAVGLLVMATHGRSGIGAVWAGSVASRIVARCRRPMLLVRAPGVPQTP
jgi:nucleotide-binding universal stress UspA family protein